MPTECLRLHIRANSNENADQAVKLLVRDEVVKMLTPLICNADNVENAERIIEENKAKIKETADNVLSKDFNYRAAVKLTTEFFPTRKYGDLVFNEGDYRALIIDLGSGAGDNWWCVAFPPLCFLEDGKNVQYKSLIKETIKKWRSK